MIDAVFFAMKAHHGQMYGELPYAYHLKDVANRVFRYAFTDDAHRMATLHAVAWLHDVVEDTDVTVTSVSMKFGGVVGHAVDMLTDADGSNRSERKAKTYDKWRTTRMLVDVWETFKIVKVADRIANIEACKLQSKTGKVEMYRKEHDTFLRAIKHGGFEHSILRRLVETTFEDKVIDAPFWA